GRRSKPPFDLRPSILSTFYSLRSSPIAGLLLLLLEFAFHILQNFLGMVAGLADLVNLANDAFLVDDKGHPLRQFPVGHHDAKCLGDFLLGVRQEGKRESFLVGEFLLITDLVGADADYHRICLSKLLKAVAKRARFGRSATGQGFGI